MWIIILKIRKKRKKRIWRIQKSSLSVINLWMSMYLWYRHRTFLYIWNKDEKREKRRKTQKNETCIHLWVFFFSCAVFQILFWFRFIVSFPSLRPQIFAYQIVNESNKSKARMVDFQWAQLLLSMWETCTRCAHRCFETNSEKREMRLKRSEEKESKKHNYKQWQTEREWAEKRKKIV